MSVHRDELVSNKKLSKIIEESTLIDIDIDNIYTTRVKKIYSQMLEYATTIQSLHELDKEQIETIRNILIADRKLIQVVKNIKPLRENVKHFMNSKNLAIRREYNILRHRILKITRMIHRIAGTEQPQQSFENLHRQRAKVKHLDVLRTGQIDKLLMKKEITREMATSLMNDSINAIQLTQMLIDVALILYTPKDEQVNRIEESMPIHQSVNIDKLLKDSSSEREETQKTNKTPLV